MIYLDFDEVLAIHDRMLLVGGGGQGVRDFALMHSAMERPKASFGGRDLYPTIYLKGAALMHSFVHNHAFADANKRTAFACTIRFLFLNGYSFSAEKDDIIKLTMDVEAKRLGLKDIALWLKQHAKPFKRRSLKSGITVKTRHYTDEEVQNFLDLDKKETKKLKEKGLL